jgi:hypothetical protein
MAERLVGQIQQLRGVLFGQHIDRHPELHIIGPHMDLVVRGVSPTLSPPVNHPPGQHPIPRQRHRMRLPVVSLPRSPQYHLDRLSHGPLRASTATLDVLLPAVDLGQQGAWIPQGAALGWSWAPTGAGWVQTTAVIAGLTRILKRD